MGFGLEEELRSKSWNILKVGEGDTDFCCKRLRTLVTNSFDVVGMECRSAE